MLRSIALLLLVFLSTNLLAQKTEVEVKTLVSNFEGNGSVAVAIDGSVFVNEYGRATADVSGNGTRIFKVSPEGNTQVFTDKVIGAVGNTLDDEGNYYFNNRSSVKNSTFTRLTKEGNLEAIAEVEGFSGDILFRDNKFFITNYTRPVLTMVDAEGHVTDYLTDDRLKGTTGITSDETGNIIISNFTTGLIMKVSSGKEIREIGSIPVVYPNYVIGYIEYFEGSIYATGYGSNIIYRMNMKGEIEAFAGTGDYGSKNGRAAEASFITPNGLAIDRKNRRLYISQNGNGKPASLRYIQIPEK